MIDFLITAGMRGHRYKFSVISRGRQGSFTSFTVLPFPKLCQQQDWRERESKSQTKISVEGDKMHFNIFLDSEMLTNYSSSKSSAFIDIIAD